MTEQLTTPDGTLVYEVAGAGPLVVLAHGMGDTRDAYRFVAPRLVEAGYRVASLDLRGCGGSSVEWPGYSRTDIAGDLLALVRHLGGPAVLVGHSIAGGAVTVAAAQAPDLVVGIVELAPFTQEQSLGLAELGSRRFRRAMTRLVLATTLRSVRQWRRYLDAAFPGAKPADWAAQLERNASSLREPGRMRVLSRMGQGDPSDAGAQLPHVGCPVLVVQGSLDPDWVDPEAEGRAIVAALPDGIGRLAVVEGSGHYPHTQHPEETVALLLPFLRAHARA